MRDMSDESLLLGQLAAAENQQALGELLDQHRVRLGHMVRLHLDRRVRRRIDPSDVIQKAFVEAARRLGEYVKNPSATFFVWLRQLAVQRLQMFHRHHW